MKAQRESDRKILRDLVARSRERFPLKQTEGDRPSPSGPSKVCRKIFGQRRFCIGVDRLYGELERARRAGQRDGYTITRHGEQMSLQLLEQTFHEAWRTVAREEVNAAGSAERAAFDRHIIDVAEERCRERGLDPHETEMVVGHFVEHEEVAAIWQGWKAEREAA